LRLARLAADMNNGIIQQTPRGGGMPSSGSFKSSSSRAISDSWPERASIVRRWLLPAADSQVETVAMIDFNQKSMRLQDIAGS